jgi:Flp pilus assembly protein TadG
MMLRLVRKLRRDQRGASLIELGFAAPILSAMVIGMTDLARAYSVKLTCEQAAQRTIEEVENQKSVATSSYNTQLTTEATNAMTAAGYSTGNTYTANSWHECSSNGTTWTTATDFTTPCASGTTYEARYASIKVQRSYTPMFASRIWPNADANGNIVVSGFAEVRMQ